MSEIEVLRLIEALAKTQEVQVLWSSNEVVIVTKDITVTGSRFVVAGLKLKESNINASFL